MGGEKEGRIGEYLFFGLRGGGNSLLSLVECGGKEKLYEYDVGWFEEPLNVGLYEIEVKEVEVTFVIEGC